MIDPIDGTMNFVRGFHHSAISVAYMRSGVLRAASVYNPYAEECFSALAGEGAWCNGRPIRAGELPLSESVVCCGTAPYSPQLADSTFDLIKKAFLASLDIRREGSAALDMCSAAAGRAGVIQAGRKFLQARGSFAGPGWSPAGLGGDFIVFLLFWD